MVSDDIKILLDRYWRCETSPEEEARLRTCFMEEEKLPPHLLRYKALFTYQAEQREEGLDEEFDARMLAQISAPTVKAHRLSLTSRLLPLFRAVAVVAVVVALGSLMRHSIFADNEMMAPEGTERQITTPSGTLSAEGNKVLDVQLADTLPAKRKEAN